MKIPAQDWSGLRALWKILSRIASVLMLAFSCGISLCVLGVVCTICLYGLGGIPGLATGCIWGGWMGSRIAPFRSLIVHLAGIVGWNACMWWPGSSEMDNGTHVSFAFGAYSVATVVALFFVQPMSVWLPRRRTP